MRGDHRYPEGRRLLIDKLERSDRVRDARLGSTASNMATRSPAYGDRTVYGDELDSAFPEGPPPPPREPGSRATGLCRHATLAPVSSAADLNPMTGTSARPVR